MALLDYEQVHYDGITENNFEGVSPWPYQDTHKDSQGNPAPLLTVGIGCALSGLAEMLTIPFHLDSAAGPMARPADISRHYAIVMKMAPGMWYTRYRYTGCLWLDSSAIQALVQKRYSVFAVALHKDFPQFDTLPVGVRAALLDFIWGYGPTGFVNHKADLIAAVNRGDLTTARALSGEPGAAYAKRNAWRASLFPPSHSPAPAPEAPTEA